ncbi:hypothetical protein [Thermoactinomyces sp. DSM 45892]|uniref:hypothetical protein n=1 Tax=Thermoactinomyces sp. DSM 45892 TaxID=1882753 RepID=UPI00089C9907|nr:hypothetical protein [Thermoactinomyces sp. DSM 45892]SDZ27013.1 hypothetical protein SAMN05444416_11848 [Thermoactinomyces sp. DSM 45892]
MIPDIVDLNAPVIPGESIGGFLLGEHIQTYKGIIRKFGIISSEITNQSFTKYWELFVPFQVEYEIQNTLKLIFDISDGSLCKVFALPNYKGTLLGGIHLGMKISEAMQFDPRIKFDDDEELYYIPELKGLSIDTTLDKDKNEIIDCIAVYTEES